MEMVQDHLSESVVWVQDQRGGEDVEDEAECDGDEFVRLCQRCYGEYYEGVESNGGRPCDEEAYCGAEGDPVGGIVDVKYFAVYEIYEFRSHRLCRL